MWVWCIKAGCLIIMSKNRATFAIALHLATRKSSHNAKKFSTQAPSSPPTYQATLHCTKPTLSGSFESACTSRIPPADSFSRLVGKPSEPRPASSRKSLNFLRIHYRDRTRYDGGGGSHRNGEEWTLVIKGCVRENAREMHERNGGTDGRGVTAPAQIVQK
jgi:hypothetical protein